MIQVGLKEIKPHDWKFSEKVKYFAIFLKLGRPIEILYALEILPPPVMIVMEINMVCQIWFTDALCEILEIWLYKTGMFQDCCQDMII